MYRSRNWKSRSKSGVPVLSDIPFLGSLFGGRQIKSTRKELILLLTPKVLYSPEDARRATEELKATLETLKALEKMRKTFDEMPDEELQKLGLDDRPFWAFINMPLSDALSHADGSFAELVAKAG